MPINETTEIQVNKTNEIGRTTLAFENTISNRQIEARRDELDNIGNWRDMPPDTPFTVILEGTNPNYDLGDEWKTNCQRCVPTFEMRSRGYDVTAQPIEDPYFDLLAIIPFSVWENPEIKLCSEGDGRERIEEQMKEWGDGARAQIVVMWEYGGGHTFVAIQENGATSYVDPQNGSSDVSDYFDYVKKGETQFCRIDNLQPSDLMLQCCE